MGNDGLTTLGAYWADYEGRMIPASAGAQQRRDMEHGFYSGAFAVFMLMTRPTEGATEAEVMAGIEALAGELLAYGERVKDELARAEEASP